MLARSELLADGRSPPHGSTRKPNFSTLACSGRAVFSVDRECPIGDRPVSAAGSKPIRSSRFLKLSILYQWLVRTATVSLIRPDTPHAQAYTCLNFCLNCVLARVAYPAG
uniref:Uncharacterized protein n=1 Tax=Plectus sambesii TaxID=2011161 RepID=A0A914WDP2_9BILA